MCLRRSGPGTVALLLSIVVLAGVAPKADAARPLTTRFLRGQFSAAQDEWRFDAAARANAGLFRVNVYWNLVAPSRPADGRDPHDPAYRWAATDAAVKAASHRGLKVLITVLRAPEWAEGKGLQQATF